MGVICAIYGSYMGYMRHLHGLSVAVACAIYGSYMCYLWQMRGAIAKVELQG